MEKIDKLLNDTIDKFAEKLRSDKIKDRTDCLADLKDFLSPNGGSSKFPAFADKVYLRILEPLFKCATIERSIYVKTSRASKISASTRLSACAGVLLSIVESSVKKLRFKSVKALVDHIAQTVPLPEYGYCEPVVSDYFKSLKTILEYQPHPENITLDGWHEVIDFCNAVLYNFNTVSSRETTSFMNGNSSRVSFRDSFSSPAPSTSAGHGRKISNRSSQQSTRLTLESTVVENLLLSLKYLVSASNAPILDRVQPTLTNLCDFLASSSGTGHNEQVALESINSIITYIMTDDVSLILQTLRGLLPNFRRFWEVKSSPLKDHMLVSLLYGEVFFSRLVSSDETGNCEADLNRLLQGFRQEYCKRPEREQLQLEELDLPDHPFSSERPLSIKAFEIRSAAVKAEQPWAILYISASIILVLSADDNVRGKSTENDKLENPLKRRKLNKPIDEIVDLTKSLDMQERLFALQVLTFVFDRIVIDIDNLQPYLETLLLCLSDDNATIAAWSLLVLTSAAGLDAARSPRIERFWLQTWRLAARHITSSLTCRASCQLMALLLNFRLVRYNEIADIVDNMIASIDLNGPAECVDSASTLWSVLVLLRGRENLGTVHETSEHILRWLCSGWSPSKMSGRDQTTLYSQHRPVHHIFRLISVCLGIQYPHQCLRSALNLGLLSQAHLRCMNEKSLIEYLLLKENNSTSVKEDVPTAILRSWEINLSNIQFQNLSGIVLDFLIAESGILLRNEFAFISETTSRLTRDLIFTACSLCIVGYSMLAHGSVRETRKGKDLRIVIDKLKSHILYFVRQSQSRDLILSVYDSLEPFIGTLKHIFPTKTLISDGIISMAHGFNAEFWQSLAQSQFLVNDKNAMDLEDEFDSRSNIGRKGRTTVGTSHNGLTAATDTMAFRSSITTKICFLSGVTKLADHESFTDSWDANSFVQYLTSLRRHEILACRPFIRELLEVNATIGPRDANRLLLSFAKTLKCYEFSRCEVSMGACLDVMTGLAELWTNTEGGEVSETGGELYEWFINIALEQGISSPEVQKSISTMLQRVIKVRPEYARSRSGPLPSVRTSLFQVLKEGNIRVKFHVGQNVSEIFGLFVLKEHDTILEDVIINLPSTLDWHEGIALRLFVLAHLAASWPTLLRRCVYAIFETPEHASHAKYCLALVSKSLGLENLQALFKLFVSQIIYTWLETKPLESIPYMIFGYGSLSELLRDVQDEVIGQIVMRGKNDEATQLTKDLDKPYEELLELSFGKAAAYSIARDVAMPPEQNALASGAEVRLRKTLGKDKHASLIYKFFPEIIAIFYKTLDGVEHVERGFQRRPVYAEVRNAYQTMIFNSASETTLPANQQPSFKARCLVDEIEYLCRRTSYDVESMWTPELYVYVFRQLLNTIHPALGSLHACSVLRRIRVLISTAGSIALKYYPIEMALHALRPYITRTHCAEDAIGIVQYLVEHGIDYLKEVPSFLAGMAVSTLASLKSFLSSTQESTTQESQFRATMSKAQAFHRWFSAFLDQYASPQLSGKSQQSFKALVQAAKNLQSHGNPKRGTYESELLLEVFEDQRSKRNILSQTSQDLILGLLCAKFELPSTFRDDILGSDQEAALYAPVLWKTCRRSNYGQSYLLWVGRVLGRAYAGTGLIDADITLETDLEFDHKSILNSTVAPLQYSTCAILRLLCEIVSSENPVDVGMAETILSTVVTKANGTKYFSECEQTLPNSLIKSVLWKQFLCPFDMSAKAEETSVKEKSAFEKNKTASHWVQELCIAVARVATDDPILSELLPILTTMTDFAEQAFPYVLHLILREEIDGQLVTKRTISQACSQWFKRSDEAIIPHVKILLKAILYLRTQPFPHETAKADRSQWLEIDYRLAAEAAVRCSMFKTALLFLEISYSEAAKASRRASVIKIEEPTNLLLRIYENIDERDAFYGVQQPSSLSAMMTRLEYENAGFKSLSFRGAHYDSHIRLSRGENWENEGSMVKILDSLDLNGLSQSLLTKMGNSTPPSIDSMLRTARKLEQWDISPPISHTSFTSTVFRVFQSVNSATDSAALRSAVDNGIHESMKMLIIKNTATSSLQTAFSTLSVITEAEEILSSKGKDQLREAWSRFVSRDQWMNATSFKHISNIISCRETLFSSLSKNKTLQGLSKTSQREARAFESHALLASSRMSRHHGALQNALATATYLTQLTKSCEEAGLNITAAVQLESANVLWAQGEMTASIRMLQELQQNYDTKSQYIHVGKPELLAKLGHQISEARLEKPDEIIDRYLAPAIQELHGVCEGSEAGQVFHEFASFCDQQLQNADSLEDFHRIRRLRERKEVEVRDLERMIKSSGSQRKEKENLKSHHAKAKQWFDLDDREFQRLRDSRQAFLRQSLANYLLCLKACDKYDNDALRFSALWLENWESEIANGAVSEHVAQVGSRKFAPLMNQWSSRLLDLPSPFQRLLSSLVLRICIDHPYHGMYQIFAAFKSKGGKDETALARNAAANNIVHELKAHKLAHPIWLALHNTNISFVKFAMEKIDNSKIKQGAKVPLQRSITGQRLEQDVLDQRVPPPTMKLALRTNCDYTSVPMIARFQSDFTVASGISAPKIVTAIGTDGLKYKQLFKSGNDDLRQDSIMEQVFEQVSNLLQTQQATRQRNLGIRTYKVLPLTATSGIIEFVPNTIPLHDYLMPAHLTHFPTDVKPIGCRKLIADVQTGSVDQRIRVFRQVIDRFHPVLRYFFMERFENPDDWFDKRLAYTRSTAAISILGHVLGLGDRHGHNILLDEKTGEVVHIDLGIAFEQGRVLPVPEVVPFRLTRDVVDGMGITGTEGVFRRCCEFTLEALRNESYSIMTILDVLRYDPLYSWSLSPLRLKKMQDAQNEAVDGDGGGGAGGAGSQNAPSEKQRKDEPGEADRALTVVAKKLSKSLSVTATVNELIQQARDERNLAVLFCGWAAYA